MGRLRALGLPVPDEALLTASVATARYLRRSHPGARCFLIAKGDVADDLRAAGVVTVPDDAEAAEVVIVAGAEEEGRADLVLDSVAALPDLLGLGRPAG